MNEYLVMNRETGALYGPLDDAKAAAVRAKLLGLRYPVSVVLHEGYPPVLPTVSHRLMAP